MPQIISQTIFKSSLNLHVLWDTLYAITKNANFIFCFALRQVENESGGFMWRTFVYDYWMQTLTVNRIMSGNIILVYLVPKSTLIDQ